jgi:hypothetical protein
MRLLPCGNSSSCPTCAALHFPTSCMGPPPRRGEVRFAPHSNLQANRKKEESDGETSQLARHPLPNTPSSEPCSSLISCCPWLYGTSQKWQVPALHLQELPVAAATD